MPIFKDYFIEGNSVITCLFKNDMVSAKVQCQILDGNVNLHCTKCGEPYPWKDAVDKAIEEFGDKLETVSMVVRKND